jgi:hypothetical protein
MFKYALLDEMKYFTHLFINDITVALLQKYGLLDRDAMFCLCMGYNAPTLFQNLQK